MNSVFHPLGKLVHFYFFQSRGGLVVLREHYQCEEDALTACAIVRELFGKPPKLVENLKFDVFFVTNTDQMLDEIAKS